VNEQRKNAPPFALERLDHLVLRTKNVDRLVEFYCGLGCAVVRRVERVQLVQLAAGDSMIDIIGSQETGDGRNLDHFALRIAPFVREEILEYCAAEDIPAEAPEFLLLGADGYGPAVYIEDPDGNRVELKGPPEKPRPGSEASGS
jgi:catechol 2,3-dioxygenase-like lactoylglutathione lyase family enzyme